MKTVVVDEEDRQHDSPAIAESAMAHCACQIEVDNVTEPEWSELMGRFADANIYQTWSFGTNRWGNKNLSHLVLKRGSETLGIAQLRIIRPSSLRLGIAYLRWGPMCQLRGSELNPETVRIMAEALHEEYVAKRGLYLEILPNAFSGSERGGMFQSAFTQFDSRPSVSGEKYRTLVLDLSPSLEELRRKLDKKWRNQLNAAERNGLKVVEGEGNQEYRRFCALYTQMWKRKKFHTTVSIEEYARIQERLPDTQRMRVLICEHAGTPVAGIVCSAIGESAIYLLGATNDEGMRVKASYLLQWTMIGWLKERGFRFYDLGGIDPDANPGVYHFKSGFSGVDVSNISSFNACDNPFSETLVKIGQTLRGGLRGLKQRLVRPRLAEATR
jgi:hypothetical protein